VSDLSIYLLAYAAIIFSAYVTKVYKIDEQRRRYIILTISFLTLALLLGLRHPSMGIDLGYNRNYGYLISFKEISGMSLIDVLKLNGYQNYEKGYIILNKLIGYFSKDPQIFIFIYSLISFIPIFYFISQKSNNPLFSILVYMGLPCFVAHFSTLRQILAIGICVLSIKFIEEKQLAKFIFVVLLASTFHSSAILFLIAYPAYRIRIPLPLRIASVFAIPIIFVFRIPLFNILSKILKDNAVAKDNGSINLFLILVVIYMFCILFFNTADKKINGYLNLFYICCCCQIFGNIYMTATRVAWFFMTSLIILLPYGVTTIKSKKLSNAFAALIMAAFVVYGLYSLRSTGWAQSFPYSFHWESI